jgi:hypothetical protein
VGALIFPGVGKLEQGLNIFLQQEFGITGSRAGDDFRVKDADVCKGFGPTNFLQIHAQIELAKGKESAIATSLCGLIDDETRHYLASIPLPKQIVTAKGYGVLSKIARNATLVAIAGDEQIKSQLASEMIPLMRDELKARYVTGVTINTRPLQAHISLTKMTLLAGLYEIAQAQQLVIENRALAGALPSALDPLSYLDAVTRFSPIAMTLPLRRGNSAWHFQSEKMWVFSHEAVSGVLSQFMVSLNPLAMNSSILGLNGLAGMSEKNVWRLLKINVQSLNRLLSYLIDPRHFADASNRVDFLRQAQAHSAVHLLFADISAMNYATAAHHRISFAFSALDKLANLRVQLGGAPGSEAQAFKALCTLSQRDELARLYRSRCGALGYEELGNALCATALRCFDDLHTHLGAQVQSAATSEAARLDRLWSQRNVRHGAFLQRGQFEKLFLESHGKVPDTIGSLPFLLALGLSFDPGEFLKFRPTVCS